MKEISRECLHSSVKVKPKEVQDKFLEVANALIRKGSNTSYAIQEANKAVAQFELELQEKELARQEEIKNQNRIKLEKSLGGAIKLPPPIIQKEEPQVDPEEIESIYFDDEGKLIIRFGDGYIIKSKNIAPAKLIEERTAIAAQYPFFDWIQFNREAFKDTTLPHEEGLVFYDYNSHSLAYYNDDDDVTVNLGQEQLIRVYNSTGATLGNGKVVYVSGAETSWPTASLAIASNKSQVNSVIGLTTSIIEPNSFGYVCILGLVNGLDTSAYSVGTDLYLSATTPGEYTDIPPLQPNYALQVAKVIHSGTDDGRLLVKVMKAEWFPNLQLLDTSASTELPTTPTVIKPSTVAVNDGFTYSPITGEITFNESQNYTLTIQFNALPSASNKNIYFYAEEYYAGAWTISRYTARQVRLVNQIQDQVQITATRYVKTGTKYRFYIWADATVNLVTTDLPGTTPGTVTLPAIRLSLA